ncbi:MAG: sugar ABC transporter permease [Butyrivibrio sp.]|uniref:carbohydrate ABC transporter permease n=1 Tax=Butyrivibrio sp. TaxID=28121 RepID=UPI001B2F6433|nr:sugar ABC transporter permease [Butyrivibrio sp.]MBO6242385.1 sugar ABC transporter permease [Butyrivibrio sp.]
MRKKSFTKRSYQAYLYLLPWFIGLVVLQLVPFVSSFVYSFNDYTVGSKLDFVGLANYVKLFTKDKDFWNSLKVTILFALYTVPGKVILALLVAMFLNRNIRGINAVRTLYYIPSLFGGSVAIALLWRLMFMDNGVVNAMLSKLGFGSISFLGDTKLALPTICLLEIWQFGSSMVMLLAALKNVPKELYEAADIDGSGKITKFFHITLPQISPILFFAILNQNIQELQNFTSPYTITGGGPMKSTNVLGILLYKEGFSYFKMGYASAISWIEFAIILVFTLVLFGSSKFWVHYADE